MMRSTSLQRYIASRFIVATLVPVVIITVLVWLSLSPLIRKNIVNQNQSVARTVVGQLYAHLMGGERQLNTLARIMEDREKETARALEALFDYTCGDGEIFEAIYLTGDTGRRIDTVGLADSRRYQRNDLQGIDVSTRDYRRFISHQGEPAWSDPFLSTVSGRLAVAVIVPIGVELLIGEITLEQLSSFISHLPLQSELRTIVWDRNERILADSLLQLTGQQLSSALAFAPSDSSQQRLHPFTLAGKQFVGSVSSMEKLGWKVQVSLPEANAAQPVRITLLINAVGFLGCLCIILLVSLRQGARLSSLVARYIGHAREIAKGNYTHQWPQSTIKEYSELGESLQRMARKIDMREQELIASEAHMRTTLDSIADAVITTDEKGNITQLNPMAEQLTGWTAEQAVGRQLSTVVHVLNQSREAVPADPVEIVLTTGSTAERSEYDILISREGHEYLIANSAAPIHDVDGQVVGVVMVFRDVTETFTQELIIRDSESRLRQLTNNIPGAVIQIRTTRDHMYRNEFLSEKTIDIFGLEPDTDTLLDQFYRCIPDEDKERYRQSMHEAIDNVQPWQYEGRFIKPDGQVIWFSAHANPKMYGDALTYYGVLTDITERKQMEASLRLTQFCFEKAAFSIYLIGSTGKILGVNEMGCASLGYSREEMLQMTIIDVDPDFTQEVMTKAFFRLRQMAHSQFEARHQHKNGRLFPVEVHTNYLIFEEQELAICFVKDISERKQWEKELKESERRYRNLFNNAPMMYVIANNDEEPVILDVNDTFLQRLEYSREEVVATFLTEYYTPRSRRERKKQERVPGADEGFFIPTERELVAHNGEVVPVIVDSTPEYDEHGKIIGTRSMYLDNTERKKVERERDKLRVFLTNLYNSMPSVLIGVDSTLRVTHWNRQAERYTGISLKEAALQPLTRVFTRLENLEEQIRAALHSGEMRVTSNIPVTIDDRPCYEDITIYPVMDGKEGAVIRIDDVTQRVHMEEMMIQSEKMLSVGGLAAGMAHEINNPLAGLLQNIQVLENRLLSELPANIKAAEHAGITLPTLHAYMEERKIPKFIGHIQNSGSRISSIVRNMLSFARKSEQIVSSHDLATLLDQAVELARTDYDMKKEYDFKDVKIVRRYETDFPVPCEAAKIQQVFLNILKNGAEAMAEDGATATPTFTLLVQEIGEWVKVEIADNGPGMEEATRKRIFEPFFTTKDVGKGTGLGLSVSYYIITENHGGKMQVQAFRGKGTTFVIHLPKRGRSATIQAEEASSVHHLVHE